MREMAKNKKSENPVLSVAHDRACWWHRLRVPFTPSLHDRA